MALAVAHFGLRFQTWAEQTTQRESQRPERLQEVHLDSIEQPARRNGQRAAEDMEERKKERWDHMTKVNIGHFRTVRHHWCQWQTATKIVSESIREGLVCLGDNTCWYTGPVAVFRLLSQVCSATLLTKHAPSVSLFSFVCDFPTSRTRTTACLYSGVNGVFRGHYLLVYRISTLWWTLFERHLSITGLTRPRNM